MVATIGASWKRYLAWLKKNASSAAEGLEPAAKKADLAALEKALGAPLPDSVREFWELCGGQTDADGAAVAAGFAVLSPADALREWKSWDELREKQGESKLEKLSMNCTSSPTDAIQDEYSVAGWLPLWKERLEGNYLGVDLSPGPEGHVGQVINFGRDEDEKTVLFWDFADLVDWLADEAKAGNLAVEEDEDDEDVQHVTHAFGRVVGVLQKLAEAGEIPVGRKPKPAKAAQPPVVKKAPAATKEIIPDPPAPLAPAAEAVLKGILKRLRKHLPDDRSATGYWQFMLSNPENPKGAYGGNVLSLEKRTVCDGSIDKNGIDLEYLKLCQASLAAGTPLKNIEVRYAHDGGDWRLEVGIETGANHDKLEKARRSLDLKITAMLQEYGNQNVPDWNRLSFSLKDGELEVFATSGVGKERKRETRPAPDDFHKIFAEVKVLYDRFGRIIHCASWDAEPKKVGKPDVNVITG